ncbi:MAG: hypothetical protein L0Z62_20515 [Gemmataceae bacterium]|nr:hypothetical protein [Gemmataceae bacterium]
MPGNFDPAVKTLVETAPADWLPLVNRRRRRVSVVDADIATVISGAADKVLTVHDKPPYLMHLDFQSGHDSAALPPRVKLYNGALEYRHDMPVLSVVVLLRPEADSPKLTGLLTRGFEGEEPLSWLRYEVVRVWRLPPEQLLTGGLGTLPLAPISDVSQSALPDVIRKMKRRLDEPKARRAAPNLLAATHFLLGLRYDKAFAQALMREVLGMKESTTYQAAVAEGVLHLLLMQGEARFGSPPDPKTRATLEAIDDMGQLEQLGMTLLQVSSWQELLAAAKRPRRNGRRKRGS